MVRTGKHIWDKHPAVNKNLTVGERAADFLKKWFGTWTALFLVAGWIALWISIQTAHKFDPYPYILLNLCLSCVAAVQGIILQISANRQDRINAEASEHDRGLVETMAKQSNQLLDLQTQQMALLEGIDELKRAAGLIPPGG